MHASVRMFIRVIFVSASLGIKAVSLKIEIGPPCPQGINATHPAYRLQSLKVKVE